MMNIVIVNILYSIDIIIGMIIPDELLIASYKTASIIPSSMVFIPTALGLLVYPHFVKHNRDKAWLKKNYTKVLLLFFTVNTALVLVMIIFAPFIINLLFGAQYNDAVDIFRILSIGYLISVPFRTFSATMLSIIRKNTINIIIGIITVVFNIALDLIFVIKFLVIGAAVATDITLAVSSLMLCGYLIFWLNNKKDVDYNTDDN